jgi:hypothetical protein
MKSLFLKLSKNDYVKIGLETALGALAGYALPILGGAAVFSWAGLQGAATGATLLGLRKGITLWLTNSKGEVLKSETPEVK